MKLRVFSTLLMAFTLLVSSMSPAQMQWGMGAYAGMQPCAGISYADGASSEDDETAELKQDRADLRREKRELEKSYRQQERDFDGYRDNITAVIKPIWATVILDHMDYKKNCQTCAPQRPPATGQTQAPPPPPTSDPPVQTGGNGFRLPRDTSTQTNVQTPIVEPLRPRPPIERAPVEPATPVVNAPPRPPVPAQVPPTQVRPPTAPNPDRIPAPVGPSTPGASVARSQSRMPAAEVVQAGSGVKPAAAAADSFTDGFTEGFSGSDSAGDGSPLLCNNGEPPYRLPQWRNICRDGGKIAAQACTVKGYQLGGIKSTDANLCSRALDRYARMVVEMEKTRNRLARIDEDIDKISIQLKDIKIAERANRDLEADCPSGRCYDRGSSRIREARAPSIGQTLLSLAPALIGGYVGYKAASVMGRQANEFNRQTGNQAVPLSPYIAAGTMSGVAAGLSYPFAAGGFYGGAYGGVNGGMGCSPGMGQMSMGPGGYMSPYGMYGNMGGAFGYPPGFSQGGYPIMGGGMYNPGGGGWGANGPWGTGQWPGGYPGYGLAGQLAGGFAGGFAGAAGGFAGQFAGGFAGGPYPGLAGQFAGGFAGGPYPGLAGQFAGGFAGAAGYPGLAGQFAGGFAGAAGYPGFAGQFAGGFAGVAGYPGMAGVPGFAGGFAGVAGVPGFAGALAGGYAGGYGQDPQLLQRQIEAQRSRLELQQSFISEYSSFMQKWQTYFGSGSLGGGVPGGDFNYRSPIVPGGSGPTTGTPTGRTR